jgi:hypothetical protein
MILLDEEIAGGIDDLGTDCVLDDGTPFRGIFRNDYLEDNLNDAKVDGTKSSLRIAKVLLETIPIRKGVGITVDDTQYTVRRVQPATSGFLRLVLTER